MEFKLVTSIEHLNALVKDARNKKMGRKSNFFPNSFANSLWINNRELKYATTPNSLILTREKSKVVEVYFFTHNELELLNEVKQIENSKPVIIEEISRNGKSLFDNNQSCRSLIRISKKLELSDGFTNTLDSYSPAQNDLIEIESILNIDFDPVTDRLPDHYELLMLHRNNGVQVYKENDKIYGFVIFEQAGKTRHLRYWWVDRTMRNQGIGSKLINRFMSQSEAVELLYLWVDTKNTNAIEKYSHYGFKPDGLRDDIYIF